ncbi:MAG: TAT-variant-translocated molybdopterin oxidoreductase [Verrucomicrobia bacterium]|nr:TAT-variant-translocated molybdopterin oxidoreductase [Verrucomicrobiota bacterium]
MKSDSHAHEPLDLSAIRAKLAAANGPQYWRSLEEVAQTPAFQEFLHREFPPDASVWEDGVSRRRFLQLMAASFALAGLSGCSQPEEEIVPYVRAPEEVVPGLPMFYATAMTLGGYALGLLVESHEGRPTKIEGNPQHPASLGATDLFAQASVLTLYDPDRSQVVIHAGEISTWSQFFAALTAAMATQTAAKGAGLRILTETITSPTLVSQLRAVLERFPQAKWHAYEPLARDNARAGARLAFGAEVETRYRFDQANVVLSLDADFLTSGPGWVRYARDFIDKRRVAAGRTDMNRLYAVESVPSNTGAMAEHRLCVPASRVEDFARAVAKELGVSVEGDIRLEPGHEKWIKAVVRDLLKNKGTSIVLTGDHQPPVVHALVHAINDALGNVGRTVIHTEPVAAGPGDQLQSLRELVSDMNAGKVELLVILGGNPVYDAPSDLRFADAMAKVKLRAHLGLYNNETARLCHWHVPETHYLESWSDARAFDGTVTIMQPLIAPLYRAKSAHEMMAALLGRPDQTSHDLVRDYWKAHGLADARLWRSALHDGVVPGTALAQKTVTLQKFKTQQTVNAAAGSSLEISFRPDVKLWDGRFANNGWLQELPHPITRVAWGNMAWIAPATAERLGLANGDVVELRLRGRAVQAPVWITPGQSEGAVSVALGYGRTHAGRVGNGAGFNACGLRSSDAPWFAGGLEVRKLGWRQTLATTQEHSSMEGRDLVRVGDLGEFRKNPAFARGGEKPPSLYPGWKYEGHAWGIAVDLTACIGCGACVLACQSENNIPVVGADQVARGREMHWLRIDRYYKGALDSPETVFEPVMCMHCENAPCEIVCPVGATVHSDEGLNAMVYNRCVGTRYCSNNCPYKVRRFNFYQYSDLKTPTAKLMNNPQVTVRNRGVMEKCTYCIQRIEAAKIAAAKENRPVREGEVATACQAACPTQAIVFGDINDPNSRVAKLKALPLNYGLLTELNTVPRTSYLARLRNPNPEMEG